MVAAPLLEAVDLYRFFHVGDSETRALRGLSLRIFAGEAVALLGPSGSGKSTLLACLAGLDEPDGGQVLLAGERLSRRPEAERARRRAQMIGILLQSGNLFESLPLAAAIRLQLRLAGKHEKDRPQRLLAAVGLDGRENTLPAQLSGGERARAGLAVALAAEPPLLLADEPTGEVDAAGERALLALLALHRRRGCAALIATHSAALAAWADRVLTIADGRLIDA